MLASSFSFTNVWLCTFAKTAFFGAGAVMNIIFFDVQKTDFAYVVLSQFFRSYVVINFGVLLNPVFLNSCIKGVAIPQFQTLVCLLMLSAKLWG